MWTLSAQKFSADLKDQKSITFFHHFFHSQLTTINFSRVVPSYLANDDQRLRRWCAGGRRSLARQYTLLPYWKRPLRSAGLLMTLLDTSHSLLRGGLVIRPYEFWAQIFHFLRWRPTGRLSVVLKRFFYIGNLLLWEKLQSFILSENQFLSKSLRNWNCVEFFFQLQTALNP